MADNNLISIFPYYDINESEGQYCDSYSCEYKYGGWQWTTKVRVKVRRQIDSFSPVSITPPLTLLLLYVTTLSSLSLSLSRDSSHGEFSW